MKNPRHRWPDVSLVDLITEEWVPLRQKEAGKYVGPHPHKHGSKSGNCLVVWAMEGRWWCSSCDAGGDAVDWLVDCGRADNKGQAVQILIERFGPP